MKYIAFLYQDENDKDGSYNVIVPDVNGAFSYGEDFMHAVDMAKEVLEFALEEYEKPPVANKLAYFTNDVLDKFDIPYTAIPQVIEYAPPAKKRVTVNFNVENLKIIDHYAKSHHLTRSAFLEESALSIAKAQLSV